MCLNIANIVLVMQLVFITWLHVHKELGLYGLNSYPWVTTVALF